jgi:hypothetical protein
MRTHTDREPSVGQILSHSNCYLASTIPRMLFIFAYVHNYVHLVEHIKLEKLPEFTLHVVKIVPL